MAELIKLRYAGTCAGCGKDVAAKTQAYYDRATRAVRCVPCGAPQELVENVEVANATPTHDIAGGSAAKEYSKRSERELAKKEQRIADDVEWRRSIKEQRPLLGRIAAALTPAPQVGPESQPTVAWKVGAEGERRVAEVLAEVLGIEVLHDRLVPGSRANIDHIAVTPSGVFVIDAKKYSGGVEVRNVGSLFRIDERLYVNGRDRSKIVDGVLGQVKVVRLALGDAFADVPIRGVLCFVGCEWGWIMKKKFVNGVTALWPTALPDHVVAAGEFGAQVPAIAEHLRGKLRPGT